MDSQRRTLSVFREAPAPDGRYSSGCDASIHALPKLAGSLGSTANDINEAGFVVGSVAVGVNHAAFWHADDTITDLDAWLDQINPQAGQFWTLNTANAINNLGIIAGTGTYNDGAGGLSDGTRGFVLDGSSLLVPEPASLAVLLVPGLLAMRRRAAAPRRDDESKNK